jgi:hypothetical protein
MKKIVLCLMATVLSLTFVPLQLSAATEKEPTSVVVPKPEDSAEASGKQAERNQGTG